MGAYKPEPRTTTVQTAISDAISELAELASEMRERADNTPEGLQNGETYQTVDNTAGELENVSEPDVPDPLSDIAVSYTAMVQRRKGRGTSRATRCQNACAMLSGAVDALDGYANDMAAKIEEIQKASDEDEKETAAEELQEKHDAAETLRDECQEVVDACDSLEFPGMRG